MVGSLIKPSMVVGLAMALYSPACLAPLPTIPWTSQLWVLPPCEGPRQA